MKILSVVGTRPQLIKEAALQPTLRGRHAEIFVDTGQHWDEAMAGAFFVELGLARPDYSLGIGGGGHGDQTGRMLVALEPVLASERPDVVLIYGDTNSTLAGALAAAKLDIPVAHIEAGLRSFDRAMPEEINRVVADHLSRWLFAPTPTAVANLTSEGVTAGVQLVGDVMQDLVARLSAEIRQPAVLADAAGRLGLSEDAMQPGGYVFATIHREENRRPDAIASWATILTDAAEARPVVLALHPGTRVALDGAGISLPSVVTVVEPPGYQTALALQLYAAAVITDSGGIQREASWLGVPCLVLRRRTEWLETLESADGRMVMVGLDRELAGRELRRLAPTATSSRLARERAAALHVPPAGAALAIVAAFD